ncbi:MAG: hypothetical protein GY856_04340 [bacterium]|nr:hypothetical protein [bacterium]
MSDSQEHQDTDTPADQGAAPAPAAPPQPPPGAAPGTYPTGDWQRQPRFQVFDPRRKSSGLAFFLSAMPGLGQVYLGQYQRGFVHVFVIAGTISLIASDSIRALHPLLGLFVAFFWLYNMIDAGRRAALYNRAIEGGGEIELPRDLTLIGSGGTLAGGIVLFVVGSLILLHNVWDVSMEWLEDWWPVAPILLGIYLIVKALRDRKLQA